MNGVNEQVVLHKKKKKNCVIDGFEIHVLWYRIILETPPSPQLSSYRVLLTYEHAHKNYTGFRSRCTGSCDFSTGKPGERDLTPTTRGGCVGSVRAPVHRTPGRLLIIFRVPANYGKRNGK